MTYKIFSHLLINLCGLIPHLPWLDASSPVTLAVFGRGSTRLCWRPLLLVSVLVLNGMVVIHGRRLLLTKCEIPREQIFSSQVIFLRGAATSKGGPSSYQTGDCVLHCHIQEYMDIRRLRDIEVPNLFSKGLGRYSRCKARMDNIMFASHCHFVMYSSWGRSH
jgi:hypothetical protein